MEKVKEYLEKLKAFLLGTWYGIKKFYFVAVAVLLVVLLVFYRPKRTKIMNFKPRK